MKKQSIFLFFILMIISVKINAQKKQINWITFEQLEDSLAVKPKKVFISFYTDWCVYCKKMEKSAFKNEKIIHLLNTDFYAVKMDAESKKKIHFSGDTYINRQLGKSRKPIHQIPLLLASRKGKSFSLPANIILDKNFKIEDRFFEYLAPKQLISILQEEAL